MSAEHFEGLRSAVVAVLLVCSHALAYRAGMAVARVRLALVVERARREQAEQKRDVLHLYRAEIDHAKSED